MVAENLVGLLLLWAQRIGAVLGIGTLAIALVAALRAVRRPPARQDPGAARLVRLPYTLAATLLSLGVSLLLWKPLPIELTSSLRLAAALSGILLEGVGLALYLWGLRTLGRMMAPTSGFGARLQAEPRLVSGGPYAVIRHPMYLGVILACFGGTLLFWTWTMLVFSLLLPGLAVRAWREDKLLESEFGAAWHAWARQVPGWIPRPSRTTQASHSHRDTRGDAASPSTESPPSHRRPP